MGNTFDAIGFDVGDEEAYNRMAEHAHELGKTSTIRRRGAQLHGCCWKLDDGVEVWTVLYESDGKLCYADCRPSFRSRHHLALSPWELTEYDEDGEAMVRGVVEGVGTEVVFELQNLTELSADLFRRPQLQVSIAGLTYSSHCKSHRRGKISEGRLSPTSHPIPPENACENDYEVLGTVLSCKPLCNPVTHAELWSVYLGTGRLNLDLVINRLDVKGKLQPGTVLLANIWLQGHVLDDAALAACYEGVDHNFHLGDFWRGLYRPN